MGNRGVGGGERDGECCLEKMEREKLWGELRGPLAAALRVIDKSEEVM